MGFFWLFWVIRWRSELQLIIADDELKSGFMSFHVREQIIEFFPFDEKGELT